MRLFKSILPTLVLFSIFLVSCSAPEKEKTTEEKVKEAISSITDDVKGEVGEGANNISDAMDEMGKALEGLNIGGKGKVPVVNFRALKEFFPNSVAGIDKGKTSGETAGFAGFKYSTAKAKYHDGEKRIEVNISDAGGAGSIITGLAAWSKLDVDKETDDGYERTTTFDGHKAYEKYNDKRKKGEINLIVNDRFIVQVEGRGVDMDELKSAIKKIDLDDLAKLEAKE